MREPYFHKTERDVQFYEDYLSYRLPPVILDAHQHISRAEDTERMPQELIDSDWALQCAGPMPVEDIEYYASVLFPDRKFEINALTSVWRGADLKACNRYLGELIRAGRIRYAMMTLDPQWSDEECERVLLEGRFSGFKPYPDLVSGQKGAEIGMFDFIPPSKLAILNKYKKAMTLHIPRAGRLADDNNVAEIKQIRDRYPDLKIIIAHFGRSYAVDIFREGAKKLGPYMKELYFDTAAVLNPAVHALAFEAMDPKKILWGTDLPVFLWHGRRRWTKDKYFNLSREEFKWTPHEEPPEREDRYTFFLYEQMKNMLDIIEAVGGGREMIGDIFHDSAVRLLETTI